MRSNLELLANTYLCAERGCLLWKGSLCTGGYGKYNDKGTVRRVHSVVCENEHGPKKDRRHVARHSCDVRACCNPEHLSWGTRRQNSLDARERARCGSQKVTPEQAAAIRAGRSNGWRYWNATTGLSRSAINAIWSGLSWNET